MVSASALYTGFSWWQSEVANVRRVIEAHASEEGHAGVLARLSAATKELTALHEKIQASERANVDQHVAIYRRLEEIDKTIDKLMDRVEILHERTIKDSETLRLFEAYHPNIGLGRLNKNGTTSDVR